MFSCKEDNCRRSGLCQDYLMSQMDIFKGGNFLQILLMILSNVHNLFKL